LEERFARKAKTTKAQKSDQAEKPEENLKNGYDKRQQQFHVCVISCRFPEKPGIFRPSFINQRHRKFGYFSFWRAIERRRKTIRDLECENAKLTERIRQLTAEIEQLTSNNNQLQAKVFSINRFIKSDKDLSFYT